eukprot:CAMPEP_0173433806 /NCGR_PEP_ID=MMETSP1357-20121228/11112_1 /TAXON_ID=77926 /ORGANISM="Hemiselmis rufescens, Strain PCC563" /LENGTH=84 /DNA_ID=CAMNT_0014398545 /DNA_START=32 /DNA_END=286 /DNA_ORIENTATION=+
MEVLTEAWEDTKGQKVPSIAKAWAAICLLLNVFLPGVGSAVAGIMEKRWSTVLIGVLQLATCWFIVGWIWSIYWGYLIAYYSTG